MRFRKKRRTDEEPHNNALNDILFILLFFFLIVSTLANPNVVQVRNGRAAANTKVKQSLVVSIDSLQQFYVNTARVTEDSLEGTVRQAIQKLPVPADSIYTMVINLDEGGSGKSFFAAMRAAQANKMKVVLAARKP